MVFCGYSVSWFSSLETNKNDSNSITEMLLEVAAWYPSVPILAEVVRLIPTIRYTKNVVYSVKVCQWFATDWCFFQGIPVSYIKKTDHHNFTEIKLINNRNLII